MARSDDRFRKTYNSMLAAFRTMAPGDRLPAELTLAEQNDVSRTIVRSALSRLNAAGIVAWNGRQKELLREFEKIDADNNPQGDSFFRKVKGFWDGMTQ